jgi:hypothetical protein
MADHLPCHGSCPRYPESVDHVVQSPFKQPQQILPGITSRFSFDHRLPP